MFRSACGVAWRARDPCGRLLIVGIVALFATQLLVNTSMVLGQLPVVGMTLPFMSYGGSSMVSSFLGLALIVSVNAHPKIDLGREHGPDGGRAVDRSFDLWELLH